MTKAYLSEDSELRKFYSKLIRPKSLDIEQLLSNKNQVAGHAGFFSLRDNSSLCLKPFNIQCVRGRREHLFYQLIEHFKGHHDGHNNEGDTDHVLHYSQFNLLIYPPDVNCQCIIDSNLFRQLSSFIPSFKHVKSLIHYENNPKATGEIILPSPDMMDYSTEQVFSSSLECPCYGCDPIKKSSCSRDYEKINFLCIEDLTAHCKKPCIIDIKIGKITYDPMAIKEKVLEQSSKYRRLREFGFRILGMKMGDEVRDKNYGKTLDTSDQVSEALGSFFGPLSERKCKLAVIRHIVDRLQSLLDIFKSGNLGQIKFFSSSLLIVYDSFVTDLSKPDDIIQEELISNIRVAMIDFAHVFHVHDITTDDSGIDENYMFGLQKLVQYFAELGQCTEFIYPQDLHLPQE